jgi:hypothetical protein
MKNILIFILFFGASQMQAQNVNPLADCNIPIACHEGLIKLANDFLPTPPSDCKFWDGACSYDNEISRSGRVSIGSGSVSYDNILSVWGGIISEQLKICKTEWCDYVFEDTFNLMPLPELSKWLETNAYLPGCTSENTIRQDGGYQLEMATTQQQQKIEEIFLHLFQLNHRMEYLLKRLPLETGNVVGFYPDTLFRDQYLGNTKVEHAIVVEDKPYTPVYNCSLLSSELCINPLKHLLQQQAIAPNCDQWNNDCTLSTRQVTRKGNVCIGTTKSASGYSLAVKGGIATSKFRIELCESGWCDYVFNETYPLLPLPAVEEYIKANKHLPGMISQLEVSKGEGYEMKAVKLQQQVKIEEAYLHLIELDKKKQQIQQRLSEF